MVLGTRASQRPLCPAEGSSGQDSGDRPCAPAPPGVAPWLQRECWRRTQPSELVWRSGCSSESVKDLQGLAKVMEA